MHRSPTQRIELIGFDREITEEFVKVVCEYHARGRTPEELAVYYELLFDLAIDNITQRYLEALTG